MKVTDLMVGDWVQKLEVGGHYRKGQIKAIIDDNVDVSTSDGEIHTLSVNGVEPIPLTAKILEKNGFKCSQFFAELIYSHFHLLSDCKALCIRCEKSGESLTIDCEYVHELQHALRLCGIKKEIEL